MYLVLSAFTADYSDVKCNRLSRWQTYQQQLQQFCQRWPSDYLQSLQQRKRWQRTSPNLQIGDLVLLREDNMTPLQWPTVVITDTHAGKDGKVRVVTLRTPKGTFKRPTTKLCPLPVEILNCRLIFFGVALFPSKGKFCVTIGIGN